MQENVCSHRTLKLNLNRQQSGIWGENQIVPKNTAFCALCIKMSSMKLVQWCLASLGGNPNLRCRWDRLGEFLCCIQHKLDVSWSTIQSKGIFLNPLPHIVRQPILAILVKYGATGIRAHNFMDINLNSLCNTGWAGDVSKDLACAAATGTTPISDAICPLVCLPSIQKCPRPTSILHSCQPQPPVPACQSWHNLTPSQNVLVLA